MKTIPVSLIVAGILAPAAAFAENRAAPAGGPPRDGDGRRGGQRESSEMWRLADKDGDGFISLVEFRTLPRLEKMPEEKQSQLFKHLDKDSDGKIARKELGWMNRPREDGPPHQRLWELDADKSGGVSMEEFKAGRFFQKFPADQQDRLFSRLDTNGDGVISPEDRPEPPFKRGGGKPERPPGGKPGRMDPQQMFRQHDTNGDGALSFDEFRLAPMVANLGEDEQEDRFEEMDRNHDLKITRDELPAPMPEGDRETSGWAEAQAPGRGVIRSSPRTRSRQTGGWFPDPTAAESMCRRKG